MKHTPFLFGKGLLKKDLKLLLKVDYSELI